MQHGNNFLKYVKKNPNNKKKTNTQTKVREVRGKAWLRCLCCFLQLTEGRGQLITAAPRGRRRSRSCRSGSTRAPGTQGTNPRSRCGLWVWSRCIPLLSPPSPLPPGPRFKHQTCHFVPREEAGDSGSSPEQLRSDLLPSLAVLLAQFHTTAGMPKAVTEVLSG